MACPLYFNRHSRLPAVLGAVGLFLCAVISGCGSSASATGKTLRLPLYGRIQTLDPAQASNQSSRYVASLIFSGLVKLSPDLHVIPELAVSLPTISNDGRKYTFTVRQDARFEDGRRLTANDVAYSLSRALSPSLNSAAARSNLGGIQGAGAVERGRARRLSGVQVVDQLTLIIGLAAPDAAFLYKLAQPAASIVEQSRIGRFVRGRWGSLSPGTGPWKPLRRDADGSLELVPRQHFYGGALGLESILLVPVSSRARGVQLYDKGLLDVARVPTDSYARLSARSDFVESSALDGYYAIPSGSSASILAANLQRDTLTKNLPVFSPMDQIVPPAVPDYLASPPGPASLTGFGSFPRAVTLEESPRNWATIAIARALGQQWHVVAHGGELVRIIHLSFDIPDPSAALGWVSRLTKNGWYRSQLVQGGELSNDPVTRMNVYSGAETWALEQGFIIPLANGTVSYLVKPSVSGLDVTAIGLMPDENSWPAVSIS